jgi:hypothetical protein
MQLPLPVQSYPSFSVQENTQSLVNMFAVSDSAGGRTNIAYYPTPGLKLFVDLSGASVIAMTSQNNIAYIVYNDALNNHTKFVSVNSSGTETVLGTIVGGGSLARVSIAAINDQLLIATGSTAYLYVISTNTLSTVSSGNFPANCTQVAAISAFFVAFQPGKQTFNISNLADGLTWQALQFASTTTFPDILVSGAQLYQQLYLIGQSVTEIWGLSGQLIPLQSNPGYFLNYGCAAADSVAYADNSLVWLSRQADGQFAVIQVQGNTPTVVSTPAMTNEFSTYSKVSDARAYAYLESKSGHEMYVINFPTAAKTWVLDLTTNFWFELRSQSTSSNTKSPTFARHRSNCYANINGINLVGDYQSGKIFSLDNNTYVDDSTSIIPRIIVTPALHYLDQYISIYELQLLCDVGVGLNSGQGSNPLLGLSISRDSGRTYSNQRFVSLGAIGQYKTRVKWTMLGAARNFVFKFTMTDPIPFVVLGGNIKAFTETEEPRSALNSSMIQQGMQ